MLNVTEEVCDVDNTNTLGIEIIFMMGVIFVIISGTVSFFIEKIDRKVLLSKKTTLITFSSNKIILLTYFAALWLFLTSTVCISIVFVQQFYIMVVCFILFLSCGLCAGIISAISVALYPTNYRYLDRT